MFSTLTTVGFGDLCPISDSERIFITIVLMFGVAVFSLVFSSFKNTLDEVGNLNSDIDESHHLSSFIIFLKNFNNQEQMDQKFKKRIEKFFKYKWKNDRNYVMR